MDPQEDIRCSARLNDIKWNLSCPLCKGYLIDCVASEECGHVYCRSCIMRHIANGVMTCPQCHQFFNPDEHGKPFQKLRPDYAMQRLVYKLVPGLLSRETGQRAQYLKSEQEARRQIRRSVGDDAPFFNERSNILVQLKKRRMSSISEMLVQNLDDGKQFLRAEMSTPLTVLGEYLKLRMRINAKCSILLSETASSDPLPDSFRLIELAYLTKWNQKRPLVVYYEPVLEPSNQWGSSGASSPMLAVESNPKPSSSNEPVNNQSSSSFSLASSPDYAAMTNTSLISSSSVSSTTKSNLKMKLHKNRSGWSLASSSSSGSYHPYSSNNERPLRPLKSISVPLHVKKTDAPVPASFSIDGPKRDVQEVNEMEASRARLLSTLRDYSGAKIAKVLPLPAVNSDASAQGTSPDNLKNLPKDPASKFLMNIGLIPTDL